MERASLAACFKMSHYSLSICCTRGCDCTLMLFDELHYGGDVLRFRPHLHLGLKRVVQLGNTFGCRLSLNKWVYYESVAHYFSECEYASVMLEQYMQSQCSLWLNCLASTPAHSTVMASPRKPTNVIRAQPGGNRKQEVTRTRRNVWNRPSCWTQKCSSDINAGRSIGLEIEM